MTFRLPLRHRLWCVLAVFGALGSAHGFGFSGNTTTSLLMSERPGVTEEPVARMPVYQSLTFQAGGLGDDRLFFEGSARAWYDLKDEAGTTDDIRLYRAVLRWRDRASGLNAGVGRQYISEGVGRLNLDGAYVQHRGRTFKAAVYGGQPLRRGAFDWERWGNDAYQWGGALQWRFSRDLRLQASYTEMRQDGELGRRLVGIDGAYHLSSSQTIRGNVDVDAADGALDRARVMWLWQPRHNCLYTLEARTRQPRLMSWSGLKDIDEGSQVSIVTASMVRPLGENTRYTVALSGVTSNEMGGNLDLGITWRTLKAGVLTTKNGSVMGSALYLQGAYRVNPMLTVGGRSNLTRWELDEADEWSRAVGSALYVTVNPLKKLEVTGEVHHITDDTYSYIFEGLLVVRYNFEMFPGE